MQFRYSCRSRVFCKTQQIRKKAKKGVKDFFRDISSHLYRCKLKTNATVYQMISFLFFSQPLSGRPKYVTSSKGLKFFIYIVLHGGRKKISLKIKYAGILTFEIIFKTNLSLFFLKTRRSFHEP